MIKPGEIQTIAGRLGLRDTQIEKDYIIGWILRGISQNQTLLNNLAFKGGTALRKVYYPDYRLSEDLDFTAINQISSEELKNNFNQLLDYVFEESRLKIEFEEGKEHQTSNYNFYLNYRGPLGGSGRSVKVDISNDEKLSSLPVKSFVHNVYSDLEGEFSLLVYPINEIITEKTRSLVQRTLPRDLYDVWYLLEIEGLDIPDFVFDFITKMEYKGYDPHTFVDKVKGKKVKFQSGWNKNLSNQIQEIPEFEDTWRQVSAHLRKLDKFMKESK